MPSVPAWWRPRFTRRERIRLGLIVAAGLLAGTVALASLLPTWLDVRNMFTYALGRSGRDVNEQVFRAPLPPLQPGFQGPRTRPPPPRGPIGPLPEVPTAPIASGDPATGKSYEFYMKRLQQAHELEARQRGSGNSKSKAPAPAEER